MIIADARPMLADRIPGVGGAGRTATVLPSGMMAGLDPGKTSNADNPLFRLR
jgi:hypothetical protein